MTPSPKPQLSHIQKSKQAYKQRKEAKFIQRAKQLTKVARLKKKLGLQTDSSRTDETEHNDIDNAVDITNTDTTAVTTPVQSTDKPTDTTTNQQDKSNDTKTQQQRHIIRNRIKNKMNSRTARGQPHLNLQMEVLYTKLLQQNK